MVTKIIIFMGIEFEIHYHEDENGLTIDNLIHTTTLEDFSELLVDTWENELKEQL
jgi:hypothetical protein